MLFLAHHASQYHNDEFFLHFYRYWNFGSLNYEFCMLCLISNDKLSPHCFRATTLLWEFADTYISGIYISTIQIALLPLLFFCMLRKESRENPKVHSANEVPYCTTLTNFTSVSLARFPFGPQSKQHTTLRQVFRQLSYPCLITWWSTCHGLSFPTPSCSHISAWLQLSV